MRRYELMVIVSDTLEEPAVRDLLGRVEALVGEQGGRVVMNDYWGKRPLAYEIAHRQHGYYAVLDLEISPQGLAEVERQLKISDDVVRFKSIRPGVRVRTRS